MQPQSPQLITKKRQGSNQYYDQQLAEGVLPLRMMRIPAGSFIMGSPNDEPERDDSEIPPHRVTLSQFFLAKYPITQSQWRVVANLPQVERKLNPDPSRFRGDMCPVERVSWFEAVEFCGRLTTYTNRQYRLPSESEWEYACRAGTTTLFHFGNTLSTDYANYSGSFPFASPTYRGYGPEISRGVTVSVDQFEVANAFGLRDMHGNVYEWCQDYWHENYEGAPTDGGAWIKGGNTDRRVRRGGSWSSWPIYCRSAYRGNESPDAYDSNIGFRVCCSAPRTQMSSVEAEFSKSTVLSASFSMGGTVSTSVKNSVEGS
jgi:formylglycine-generating enzyme required for sulfatase activity